MCSASHSHHLKVHSHFICFLYLFYNVLVYFNWEHFHPDEPSGNKGKEKGFFSLPSRLKEKKRYDKTEEYTIYFFSDRNSCLHVNFNCNQNFNGVARQGS